MTNLSMKNMKNKDDDYLIERKEEIIGDLTAGKGTALDDKINELLEIERELTLREE